MPNGRWRRPLSGETALDLQIKPTVRETDGICVLELSGEVDVYTSPMVKDKLQALIESDRYRIVVNLKDVRYIDSTGLGILIGALKRVREHNGSVNLVITNPQTRKVFEITGLVKIFGIFDTEEQALSAFQG